jgi:threonine synthase
VSGSASRLACAGCGWAPGDGDAYPFRCARAGSGDDVDHVMARVLDPDHVAWPSGDEANPFVRFRALSHSYHVATARGMRDADYVELVERLDKAVGEVDGHGFAFTPFVRDHSLGHRLGFEANGRVWVKDETGNVSGSHKARHLMGLAIHLEVAERLGLAERSERPLAIASCGNAALAAAVVAQAAERTLHVFVPTWADRAIVRRLEELKARVNVIPREEGLPGDPTYHALQRAVAEGAIPFTCQGPDNGLTIEGGKTLAYEMVSQAAAEGVDLDALFVQVGGGALGSAVIQGFREALQLGALSKLPRLYAVQTLGGHPLKRAYDRLRPRIVERLLASGRTGHPHVPYFVSRWFGAPEVQQELTYARTHRSEFMWPWEWEPKSIATGILDDETYDWYAVVAGMLETGGNPVVVDEEALSTANDLGRSTGIDVDPTGTAGLAGLLEAGPADNRQVAVLFTGRRRET